MNKSVYSLVLMDDIIKAVDREAYRLGTSRSNLINQILAQHLACETPEMRMRSTFDYLSELIGESFRIQQQRSASLMTMRTSLDYKYHPTISYKVELQRAPDQYIGTLRVQIRTQSQLLLNLFKEFFMFRIRFEAEELAKICPHKYVFSLTDECFTRKLYNSGLTPDKTGEAISRYIRNLDSSLQSFLASPSESEPQLLRLGSEYLQLINDTII